MKYLISYSGGLGSFMAAKLTVDEYGPDNCRLIFTDTKTEDEDLYRFLNETAGALKAPLEIIADGRNIWEVMTDHRFQSNSRVDHCSEDLKRRVFRRYVRFSPKNCRIILGIGADERHRMISIRKNWKPYTVNAPLTHKPHTKEQILDVLADMGIEPPRLYEMGFPHNNCGGFCVKTGQKQMALLLKKMPERYAWHEEQQEKLFKIMGKRHGFIRKVVGGEMHYLSLKEFREMLEAGTEAEMYNEAGCGCFL